jgi:hypothetical protein
MSAPCPPRLIPDLPPVKLSVKLSVKASVKLSVKASVKLSVKPSAKISVNLSVKALSQSLTGECGREPERGRRQRNLRTASWQRRLTDEANCNRLNV